MRVLHALRCAVKRWLARRLLIVEYCHACGRRQPLVWLAPDALWLELIGRPGDIRCPECFDALARSRGVSLLWRPEVDSRRVA